MYSRFTQVPLAPASRQAAAAAFEYGQLAENLLLHSAELLRHVLEIGASVTRAASFLSAAVVSANSVGDSDGIKQCVSAVEAREATITSVKDLARQVALAAIDIRRLIGWDAHPYLPAKKNGSDTLIGIEGELREVFTQAISTAELSAPSQEFFTIVVPRIQAMLLGANQNTFFAIANAKDAETIGVQAIKVLRFLENKKLSG